MNKLAVALAATLLTVGGVTSAAPAFAGTGCRAEVFQPATADLGATVTSPLNPTGDCTGETVQFQMYENHAGVPLGVPLPTIDLSTAQSITYTFPDTPGDYELEAVGGTILSDPTSSAGASMTQVGPRTYNVYGSLKLTNHVGDRALLTGTVAVTDNLGDPADTTGTIMAIQRKNPDGSWVTLTRSTVQPNSGNAVQYGLVTDAAQTYRMVPEYLVNPANTFTYTNNTLTVPKPAVPARIGIILDFNSLTRTGGTVVAKISATGGDINYQYPSSGSALLVSPGGLRIQLQRYVNGAWATVGTGTTIWSVQPYSPTVATIKATAPRSKWRLHFAGNTLYAPSTSWVMPATLG